MTAVTICTCGNFEPHHEYPKFCRNCGGYGTTYMRRKQYMATFWGKPISNDMSKKELLEVIEFLVSELARTRENEAKYLSAADPLKLIAQEENGGTTD